jgi:pyruvate dehydrogenase E2 component (dihydrolipoamide acetyltransferase)
MSFEIRVPSSGELGDEITLVAWRKKRGDSVERGDVLAEIEADKGVLEIEAVVEGTLGSITVEEGASVEPGAVIGIIRTEEDEEGDAGVVPESSGEATAAGPEPQSAAASPKPDHTVPETSPKPSTPAGTQRPASTQGPAEKERPSAGGRRGKAAPIARRMAREAGIDLEDIPGTGPGGIITRTDAEAYIGTSGAAPAAGTVKGAGPGRENLTPNRKSVIRTVTASHREIPSVRFAATVSMERALGVKRNGGFLWDSLFVKAASEVIGEMPVFTSFVVPAGGEGPAGIRIEARGGVNIAFALGRGEVLYAPVVRSADSLSLGEIDRRIRGYVERAETGRFSRDDFAEGCFLISNLGKYGLDWFEAMVYPGHSAALSFGAVQEKPIVLDGGIHVKPVMEIVLAADHRIVNGIQAAEFLQAFKEYLEEKI